MSRDVDAVIAALKVVLKEAEERQSEGGWWPVTTVNRWIGRLPGADDGLWDKLILEGDEDGTAEARDILMHARATIAYLEANRDGITGA
ncbi:MAG: hypothetical protein KDJ41_07945 [Hyphomicrobiaceae bacterium]|nr:hypothetical protein [Hyphomicrobiaceae bacterium]